jgi:hypothetical protein
MYMPVKTPIPIIQGPVCDKADWIGVCDHNSCWTLLSDQAAIECPRGHGLQRIVKCDSGGGFAGGRIYWTILECGCVDLDESDDIRAAY